METPYLSPQRLIPRAYVTRFPERMGKIWRGVPTLPRLVFHGDSTLGQKKRVAPFRGASGCGVSSFTRPQAPTFLRLLRISRAHTLFVRIRGIHEPASWALVVTGRPSFSSGRECVTLPARSTDGLSQTGVLKAFFSSFFFLEGHLSCSFVLSKWRLASPHSTTTPRGLTSHTRRNEAAGFVRNSRRIPRS